MSDAIVGLDVGTSVVKAVLFDLGPESPGEGAQPERLVATRTCRLHTPQPGWAELDPEEMWQAVVAVLRAITEQVPPETHIRAVALASQGGTLIPCRVDGMPTYRAITWLDRRSKDLAAQWRAEGIDGRVRRLSGWYPEPGLPLVSIAWLRRERPEVFAATERFLSVNDFLAQRLTGWARTNPSMAGEMLLTDIRTGQWSEELCHLVGISPEQLSPILPATAVLGHVQPEVGQGAGVGRETAVINGGQDHSCEALALGLTAAGTGLLACGTAWVINAIAESAPIETIPAGMDLNYHVVPSQWVVSQFLGGLGACMAWWAKQCGQKVATGRRRVNDTVGGQNTAGGRNTRCCAPMEWEEFDAAVVGTAPGCGGLIYLPQTGVCRAELRGAHQHGGFVGLRLDHSSADMGRAIMEGAAYVLRWVLDDLQEAGLPMEQIWMIGGATQSPLWPQIVADVSGVPVLLSQYAHGPALGAAMLATVGLGIFDSVEAAQAHFRVSPKRLEPEEDYAGVYDRQFTVYRRLAEALLS